MRVVYESVLTSLDRIILCSTRCIEKIQLTSEEFDELLMTYHGKLPDLSRTVMFCSRLRVTKYKGYIIEEVFN